MSRIAYVNGRFVPRREAVVSAGDRGFQFADSVYEVVSCIGGVFADERGHLDRLERSLSELDIPMPMSRRALRAVMRETVRRNRARDAQVYIQVTRGAMPRRDFSPVPGLRPTLVITVTPLSFDPAARKAVAKHAVTLPETRWARRDIKTTMLLPQCLARAGAARAGAQEAWFVDEEGFVTEATASNAWILDEKGVLRTRPAAGNAVLKGVTGTALRALCAKEGIRVAEEKFTPQDAYKAREAFTSSANALFVPIISLDGRKIGTGGPGALTQKLLDLYFRYARKGKHVAWTPE